MTYTPHQKRFFAEQLLLKRPQSSIEGLASSLSGVKVDLNPHQVEAALFALRSPLSGGALLADEVGLGKTIEAGLVLAQRYSERKRRIILIVPASLRTQWRAELEEKFFIRSEILESKNYNKAKKDDPACNPFVMQNAVVICSYNFASAKHYDLSRVNWDLVIIDEAHRLRNVYKSTNVMGNRLKSALTGCKKLLLTATPLQNNLMELYGLVSIIDDRVFGSAETFNEVYVKAQKTAIRNQNLRNRLQCICKRTLRSQVKEYVPYTNRFAITQDYTPSTLEETLYNQVSEYLRRDDLYSFPQGQRQLLILVVRKLLASSSMAIHGTLSTVIGRLQKKLMGYQDQLSLSDFDDYDGVDELIDIEVTDEYDTTTQRLISDCEGIQKEIEELQQYAELAASITTNAKGDNLLIALEKGFEKNNELGGARKAVIFTESKRTQRYLMNLLSNNGYEGKILFLDGSNDDANSKFIYDEWRKRHKNSGAISGSKQADIKSAIVEEFRSDRASILLGTEAAAEGINLQFCNIVVNYDLPWNPQRIEQRIGRCHRYGQKHDVIVINFLNQENAADRRVFELLEKKFNLFSGIFGSSDEILGAIEDGVDFEKRILEIYQTWRAPEDIMAAFDALQEELTEQIHERMTEARQSILDNFDENVAARLKGCETDTRNGLGKFSQWMFNFFVMNGAKQVKVLSHNRFAYIDNGEQKIYNLNWKDAEEKGDMFLRLDDPLCREWLTQSVETPLSDAFIRFDYTNSGRSFSDIAVRPNLRGVIFVDKLTHRGIEDEEHLIISASAEDGIKIDDETVSRIMELPAALIDGPPIDAAPMTALRQAGFEAKKADIERRNMDNYMEQCNKIDMYTEELKEGLERELKTINRLINEKKKETRTLQGMATLEEMLKHQDEIRRLENERKTKRRDLCLREDELDRQREALQNDIRKRLDGEIETETIMAISFDVV